MHTITAAAARKHGTVKQASELGQQLIRCHSKPTRVQPLAGLAHTSQSRHDRTAKLHVRVPDICMRGMVQT